MGNYFDVIGGMKASFANFRDKELLKWSVIYILGEMAAGVVDALIGLAIAGAFMLATNGSISDMLNKSPNLGIVGAIAGLWLVPRLMRAAMAANGISIGEKPPSVVDWFVLNVRRFFIDLTCWYDKKLLIPAAILIAIGAVAGVASLALPMVLIIALGILALGLAAWAIAMVVHSLRTNFCLYMFLRGDGKEGGMPRKSFDLVKGQTLQVFLAQFLFVVILAIAFIIIAIPMIVIAFVPCIGAVVDAIVLIVLVLALTAFSSAYWAGVFKFFCEGGPAAGVASAKKSRPAAVKKAAKKAKKKK